MDAHGWGTPCLPTAECQSIIRRKRREKKTHIGKSLGEALQMLDMIANSTDVVCRQR